MDAAKKLLRIDADESGESRFAADEIALSLQEFAPPAAPLLASGAQAAARWVLLQLPLGWVGEPIERRDVSSSSASRARFALSPAPATRAFSLPAIFC